MRKIMMCMMSLMIAAPFYGCHSGVSPALEYPPSSGGSDVVIEKEEETDDSRVFLKGISLSGSLTEQKATATFKYDDKGRIVEYKRGTADSGFDTDFIEYDSDGRIKSYKYIYFATDSDTGEPIPVTLEYLYSYYASGFLRDIRYDQHIIECEDNHKKCEPETETCYLLECEIRSSDPVTTKARIEYSRQGDAWFPSKILAGDDYHLVFQTEFLADGMIKNMIYNPIEYKFKYDDKNRLQGVMVSEVGASDLIDLVYAYDDKKADPLRLNWKWMREGVPEELAEMSAEFAYEAVAIDKPEHFLPNLITFDQGFSFCLMHRPDMIFGNGQVPLLLFDIHNRLIH